MYIMADKYQLQSLKSAIIRKLEKALGRSPSPDTFFKAARRVYDHVPESDTKFRDFFIKSSPALLPTKETSDASILSDYIKQGGAFAADLFTVQRDAFSAAALKVQMSVSHRNMELKEKALELTKAQEIIQKAKANHEIFRGDYKSCSCASLFR